MGRKKGWRVLMPLQSIWDVERILPQLCDQARRLGATMALKRQPSKVNEKSGPRAASPVSHEFGKAVSLIRGLALGGLAAPGEMASQCFSWLCDACS